MPKLKPRKLLNFKGSRNEFPEHQGKLNIIKSICDKAIQIRNVVEQGAKITLPGVVVNHSGTQMTVIAISEDGFKVQGNDNILEYVWLETKELNKILQTLLKLKLPKTIKLPMETDSGLLETIEVLKK